MWFRCLALGAAVAAFWFSGAGCDKPPDVPHNTPPTILITSGPDGAVSSDTVRFEWQGQDVDGNLAGYRYGIDDSTPDVATESLGVTFVGLAWGAHDFYVQALDDSGARSLAAVRSFSAQHLYPVAPRGTDTTFDLAAWNIENMPKSEATVAQLQMLIPGLGLDLYAIEEIADTIAFRQVLAGITGYAGLFSADDYGSSYQKTGVIYRQCTVSVADVHKLFWGNGAFPRPPLEMSVLASHNGGVFYFRLIVLHLKAGGASEDEEKRRAACVALKSYIDAQVSAGTDSDFVVVGDWNDELDDARADNVFLPFLDDSTDYRFLTLPMAGDAHNASYIGGGLIDHVLVTTNALGEYGTGYTQTLRLDDELPDYQAQVSDHRPVMSVFPVFRP